MSSFRHTLAGIIILGVASLIIGFLIWRGTRPPAAAPSASSDTSSCTSINGRDYSARAMLSTDTWIGLNRGDTESGYNLSSDGALRHDGDLLSRNVPVTATNGADGTEWTYAQSVYISPDAPGGDYALLRACEMADSQGLCWALYVIHLDTHRIERTSAGHYGITGDQLLWIPADDPYAVVRYQEEGATMHYRIHLPTGSSTACHTGVF